MDRYANWRVAGDILAKVSVNESQWKDRAIAKAQVYAILALAEQFNRIADALERNSDAKTAATPGSESSSESRA